MDSKTSVWTGATIGSLLGGLIPLLWGAGEFSFSSIIFGGVGAIIGIFVSFKMSRM